MNLVLMVLVCGDIGKGGGCKNGEVRYGFYKFGSTAKKLVLPPTLEFRNYAISHFSCFVHRHFKICRHVFDGTLYHFF